MSLSVVVELVLSALLVLTLGYCALLERKLSLLRKGQDALKETISGLNTAIANASVSMQMLKTAAAGASEKLEEEIARGRGLADELAVLAASGERIAERIERGGTKNGSPLSGALASRLDSLKPRLRSIR